MTDAQIRELAREILSRDEYARWREAPGVASEWLVRLSDLLRDAWDWIVQHTPGWFSDLFSWVSQPAAADALEPIRNVFAVIAVVAVAWLGIALLRGWLAQSRGRRSGPISRTRDVPGEDLRARAEQLARDGRFLEAAHVVQLAALELLLERRWIELDRFEPNRTLRARLLRSSLPRDLSAEFAALLDRLEARWFGNRAEERNLYDGWSALHARLSSQGAAR